MLRSWSIIVVLWSAVASAAADVVELRTTGPQEQRQQVEASIREFVERVGVKVSSTGDRLATVTVDFDALEATVRVIDRHGTLVLARSLHAETSTLAVEAAAYIVQSAVSELLALEQTPKLAAPPPPPLLSATTEPPTTIAPEPSALQELPDTASFELGAMLSGRAFGAHAVPVFGGGLWADLRLWPHSRWAPSVAVLATYNGPFLSFSEVMQLSTQSVSLRLMPSLRLFGGEKWRVDAHVGGGADVFISNGRSNVLPADHYEHDRTDVSPMLSVMVAVHGQITPATALFATVGADFDLWPHRYVTSILGAQQIVFDPWRVRPTITAGFTFDFATVRGAK